MMHKKFSLLLTVILTLGMLTAKATPLTYTYTFLPNADDFNSQGFGGTITLDAPSSSHGQLSDILGLNIYGPYINTESFDAATESLTVYPDFSWTANIITSMTINVTRGGESYVFSVYDNGLYEAGMDAQANGTWVNLNNAVPDGAETSLLLGFSLSILALLRHGAKRLPAFARR